MKRAIRNTLLAVLILTVAQSLTAGSQANFDDPPPPPICPAKVCP